MRTFTPRARFITGFLAVTLAATLLLAGPGFAETRDPAALGDDPRNKAFFDSGYCYGHHYPSISPDWMNPGASASGPAEVVAGEPFQVNLTLFKNWDYDMPGGHGILNLTGAPGVRLAALNVTETEAVVEGEVPRGGERDASVTDLVEGRRTVPLVTPANPTTLSITLEATGPVSGTPVGATPAGVDLDLRLEHPDGGVFFSNTTGGAPEVIDIPHEDAVSAAGRHWNVTVTYKNGVEPFAAFRVTAIATHDVNATRHHAQLAPAMLGTDLANHTFTWTLVADEPGEIVLDFRAQMYAYHTHTPQDEGHTTDDGNITRYDRVVVTVLGEARPASVEKDGFALPALPVTGALAALAAAALVATRRTRP